MRNLLQFIIKYSNFLLFLALEIAALVLIFSQNGFQRSVYLTSTGRVTGSLYAGVESMNSYFHLVSENADLVAENAQLMNRIQQLENNLERYIENDSSVLHPECAGYVYAHKGISFMPAKIIRADLNKQCNIFTLNKGSVDGVQPGFGVLDQRGVVGIISTVNEHFSLVLPLVNTQTSISCRFANNSQVGPLRWDGMDVQHTYMQNVPRHSEVHVGDTIVTSGLTTAFPEGLVVGFVDEAVLHETDAFYQVRVRFATDFAQTGYVQIICNEKMREQEELEATIE